MGRGEGALTSSSCCANLRVRWSETPLKRVASIRLNRFWLRENGARQNVRAAARERRRGSARAFDVARREIADEHRLGVLNNGQTKTSAPETPRSARSCCSSLSAFSRMGDSDEAHVVSHQRWRVTCDRARKSFLHPQICEALMASGAKLAPSEKRLSNIGCVW